MEFFILLGASSQIARALAYHARRCGALAKELRVIGAYALLTAIMTYPLVLHLTQAVPGGGGDSWQLYWDLWWVKRALLDLNTSPYFTTDVHYPWGSTLYFHALMLIPSVLALPIVLAFGLTVAYNFVALFAFIAAGYGAFKLVFYLLPESSALRSEQRTFAAFLAGIVFTFSSYHLVRLLGHLDLVSLQWLPFYGLYLFKTWREPSWKYALLAALFFGLTTLTSWYYGLYLILFTALFVLYHLLVERRATLRRVMRVGAALGVCTLALAPVLVPMLALGRTSGRVGDPAGDTLRFSADLLAFIVPSPLHSLWGQALLPIYERWVWQSAGIESVAFLGYIPLLLAARSHKLVWKQQKFWLMVFAFFTIMALGPVLHVAGQTVMLFDRPLPLPYSIFFQLPYGDIVHVPSRFAVMSSLCLCVIAGYGSALWLRQLREVPTRAAFAVLAGAMLFENAAVPYPLTPVNIPAFYSRLQEDPRQVALLEVPIPDDPSVYSARMLYQTAHEKPVYGGYLSRGLPPLPIEALPGFAQFKTLSLSVQDIVAYNKQELPIIAQAILNRYNGGYVVIDKKLMDRTQVARARIVAMTLFDSAAPLYEDDQTLAFAVPPSRSLPYAFLYLERGWYGLEHAPTGAPAAIPPQWRWMPESASVAVVSPVDRPLRLRLRASSFDRPRRLQISLDGRMVATMGVQREVAEFYTPIFSLKSGAHSLDLASLDGTDIPGGADPRPLSFAVSLLSLESAQTGIISASP